MRAVVKRIQPKKGQRVIAISDIHGNLEVFQTLLKKINFSEKDILILVGDMLEKGPMNLSTLHYIMELCEKYEVYPIIGNCDMVLLSLKSNEENERLFDYLMTHKSTIHEMYQAVGESFHSTTDIMELKRKLRATFMKEIEWLSHLPHIIIAGNFYFAHAALQSENISENNMQEVINYKAFLNEEHTFSHTVVVGHMPVCLYDDKVSRCNPIFDQKKNIISIDGGNVIKLDGQLNALIIPDVYEKKVLYDSMDLLPKAVILETQEEKIGQRSINVRWSDGEVEILDRKDEFSYCRHCSSGYKLWILNEFLSIHQGKVWADEGTDYILPVKKNEIVSVVRMTSRGYFIKKDGVVGWYQKKLKFLDER